VDAQAEILWVEADKVMELAEQEGGTPFDVLGVELGHVDGRCSFESILVKFDLTDPALRLLARIVHDADIPADIAIEPECAGRRRSAAL
jgi:hypothetical protein